MRTRALWIAASLAAIVLAGCAGAAAEVPGTTGDHEPARQVEDPGPGRIATRAPIDELELLQQANGYAVRIVSGLPSGCQEPLGITVGREGNAVRIEVLNSAPDPDGEEIVCTMIYGTDEQTVGLPGEFVPGERYTVEVNDAEPIVFTAS